MTATAAHPTTTTGRKPLGQQVVRILTTTDHKVVGLLYIVTSLVFFLLGGVVAETWELRKMQQRQRARLA